MFWRGLIFRSRWTLLGPPWPSPGLPILRFETETHLRLEMFLRILKLARRWSVWSYLATYAIWLGLALIILKSYSTCLCPAETELSSHA